MQRAESDRVVMGGWESYGNCPPSEARWFSIVLDKVSAPWAYAKGEPVRTIAALELLGALFALMWFKDDAAWLQGSAYWSLTGYTDNQGNTFLLDRYRTSMFRLIVILIEMAVQLAAVNIGLALRWVLRPRKEEADSLTNGCLSEFTAELRIKANVGEMPFLARKELMGKVGALRSEISALRSIGPIRGPPSAKRLRLRETDPW